MTKTNPKQEQGKEAIQNFLIITGGKYKQIQESILKEVFKNE